MCYFIDEIMILPNVNKLWKSNASAIFKLLSIFIIFLFFPQIVEAKPIEYYAFLAIKENGSNQLTLPKKINNEPTKGNGNPLYNLPIGEYYLHVVKIEPSFKPQIFSTGFKIIKNNKLGVDIDSRYRYFPLFDAASSVVGSFDAISKIPGINSDSSLLLFLRKLVINKPEGDKIFDNDKYKIYRINMIKGKNLTQENVNALWTIWEGYKSPETSGLSVYKNLVNLLNKLNNTNTSFSIPQRESSKEFIELGDFYRQFVTGIYEEYESEIISALKNDNDKIVNEINQIIKKLKTKNIAVDNKIPIRIKQANRFLKNQDYNKSLNHYQKIKNDLNKMLPKNDNFPSKNNNFLIAGIFLFLILLSLVVIFIRKPKFFNSMLRFGGGKNKVDNEWTDLSSNAKTNTNKVTRRKRGETYQKSKKMISNSSATSTITRMEIVDNLDMDRNELEKLRSINQSLKIDNERLRKMVYEDELLKLANDPRFIEEFFKNRTVLHKIKTLHKQESLGVNPRQQHLSDQMQGKILLEEHLSSPNIKNIQVDEKRSIKELERSNIHPKETTHETEKNILKKSLDRHSIIRSEEMNKEFDKAINNDLLFAKSLSDWLKPNMSPRQYEEINKILEDYKSGKISLFIPKINSLFKPEEHDLTANREKEMRGKGAKVIKIVRPGVKMKEANGSTSIVSRAQVEIKT